MTRTTRSRAPGAAALLLAGLTLAGCGGTASTVTPNGTSSPASTGTTLVIKVTGSTVTPAPASVDVPVNTPVHLTVTADRTTEVHVHVVDIEKPITAGRPVTIDFTPTQQGVYEVELHDPDLLLVKLAVR